MRCSNSYRLLDLLQSVGSTAKVGQGRQKEHTRCFHLYIHAYFSNGEKVIKVKSQLFFDDDRKDWCKHYELLKSLGLHLYKVKKRVMGAAHS